MSNPVEDGVGDDRIGKESWPIGHCPVGGEDDALGAEASVDDGIEPLCGKLVNGLEAEVIDDEQINDEQPPEKLGELILDISRCKFGEEIPEVVECHREHHSAGFVGKSLRKMSFSGTGWTDEEDSLTSFDKTATGEVTYELCVNRRIEIEIKCFHSRLAREVCPMQQAVDAS